MVASREQEAAAAVAVAQGEAFAAALAAQSEREHHGTDGSEQATGEANLHPGPQG